MNPIIEIHNKEILQIGHAAEIAFCKAMATDELQCEGLVAVTIGLKDPILNVVIDTQVNEKTIQQKIAQVFEFFKQHDVAWTWIVDPLVQPTNLIHYLEQHGLTSLDQFPSLYFDLTKPFPENPPLRFDIREAPQEDDLSAWITPVAESFPTSDQGEGFRKLAAKLPHGVGTPFRHYMAYQDNNIAAAGTLFVGTDSVMIHNLATKPGARNQGLATALTLHAMQEGKRLGYQHCFLDSSTSGLNLYRRIGFQIYCVNQIYGSRE